jgi:hypothetical protein
MMGHEFFHVLFREHDGPSFHQSAYDRLPQVFQRRDRAAQVGDRQNDDAKVSGRAGGRFLPGRSVEPRASRKADQSNQKESDDAVI